MQGRNMNRLAKSRDVNRPVSVERLYYRIGEVSRVTGLKPHVLRYWESEFKVIKPHKGGSLQRLYRKKDLDLILKIKRLLYDEGFTIAGAKKKIRDFEKEGPEPVKLKLIEKRVDGKDCNLLLTVREELEAIRDMLQ